MSYSITLKGEKREVSGLQFLAFAIPLLALSAMTLVWVAYILYLSSSMFGDYTGIPAILCGILLVVVLGSLTLGGVKLSLLPAKLQPIIGLCVFAALLHYQYTSRHWSEIQVAMLTVPLMIIRIRKLLVKKI